MTKAHNKATKTYTKTVKIKDISNIQKLVKIVCLNQQIYIHSMFFYWSH